MDKADGGRPEVEEQQERAEQASYCRGESQASVYQQYSRPQFPGTEHYHQYEDEVCLKCDNAELLSRPARRNVQTEGCDFQFSKPEYRPRLPQPPHMSQVSYPGYPRVSVRPGYYDDTIPYYPPPRPFPPRFSQPRRHLPPPPRFAAGMRQFRPPPHMVRLPGPGEDPVVARRYPDYPPVRRPLSEVSARQWGGWAQPRPVDPASLPRRRLPEIPQQRRLPDTLPRTGRPSYEFEPGEPQPREPQPRVAEHKQQAVARKSPAKCQDEGQRRRTEDKYQKQEPKSTTRQTKGSSRSPSRQGWLLSQILSQILHFPPAKTVSLTETRGEERPRTRPGHSRTRSDVTGKGSGRSHRHRVRRQSPVEERLSVHESDSMSDAFDDDGLFQIDENFAKFLDDKTSCQK